LQLAACSLQLAACSLQLAAAKRASASLNRLFKPSQAWYNLVKRVYSLDKKGKTMTKSELIERIVEQQGQLSAKDVELAIKTMLEHMSQALATGERIEIRGFGSFSLHYRAPRVGRNPKTGDSVELDGKFVPHFKPGKELRDRVNESLENA
jgi:integration host factor subunit beta